MMSFAGCRGFGSMGSGMGFMGGGFLFYGIIVLLIILAAVYLINNNSRNNHHQKANALEILDSEYAKGNVTDDDYKKRKENLKN